MKYRGNLNFIIDVLLFINLAFIAGIGFLMNYTLLPGRERVLKYGENTELSFLGLDRHQWGDIHLIAGFVMLGLIVLHIFFHWKIIVALACKVIPPKFLRLGLTAVLIMVGSVLLAFTFVIAPTESQEVSELHGNLRRTAVSQPNESGRPEKQQNGVKTDYRNLGQEHAELSSSGAEIRGSMTLAGIAEIYGIPVSEVKSRLGFPDSLPDHERLGKLRREYGLTITQIKELIKKKK